MKTKTQKNLQKLEHEIEDALKRPLHLHIEYFFRKQYCLLAVVLFMGLGMAKSDGSFLHTMRDAYNYSYSKVGPYLREDPVRASHGSVYVARIPFTTSK